MISSRNNFRDTFDQKLYPVSTRLLILIGYPALGCSHSFCQGFPETWLGQKDIFSPEYVKHFGFLQLFQYPFIQTLQHQLVSSRLQRLGIALDKADERTPKPRPGHVAG